MYYSFKRTKSCEEIKMHVSNKYCIIFVVPIGNKGPTVSSKMSFIVSFIVLYEVFSTVWFEVSPIIPLMATFIVYGLVYNLVNSLE